MSRLSDYMMVSNRGNFPTRILTRPVANLFLICIPVRVEKFITPNKISFCAFLLSQAGNVYLIVSLQSHGSKVISIFIWWTLFQYFAYVLDCADGQFARKHKLASESGRVLDMLLDLARELGRLLTFGVIFEGKKDTIYLFVYLFCRVFWMASWASVMYLDFLQSQKKQTAQRTPVNRFIRLRNKVKSILIYILALPQDGFVDLSICAIFGWIVFQNHNPGILERLTVSFLLVSVTANIFFVFRRVLR